MKSRSLILASIFIGIPIWLFGQVVENGAFSKADITCLEDMQVPLYDGLMWVARASGSLRASIVIGESSGSSMINVHGEPPIILERLKSALQEAKFSSRCRGRTLELNFVYRLEGKPDDSPHNRLRLKGNNTIEVIARPHFPIASQQ
jgi:hypothetical protein